MTILDKIIVHKKTEISEKRAAIPAFLLEKQPDFERKTFSLKNELKRKDKAGIISEFKRKSPSKSGINLDAKVEEVVKGYETAGASGISVLTDTAFFGGNNDDLVRTRELVKLPILRKDFIVDEYQLIEAKAIGADVVLLIAAALKPTLIKQLAVFAGSLNLEVLLEVHNREELENSLNEYIDIVGVNNRNLKTFEVSIENSIELAKYIPQEFLKISESGLEKPGDVQRLLNAGYNGFLIGESFMKEKDPGTACRDFIREVFKPQAGLVFRSATVSDLRAIEQLAHKIWKEVYPGIISNEQIVYMLNVMYSQESLKKQLFEQEHEFTLVFKDQNMVGYIDVSSDNSVDFFIHKLYVDTAFHGKEVGKKLFDYVFAEKKSLRTIRLRVNRQNKRAISFYNKLGFKIEYEKDFDIGNNFYMCDYGMIKTY